MVFIDTEKAGKAILDFIGSDQYKTIISCQGTSVEGAFMAGLSTAYCVMCVNCDKYVYSEKKQEENAPTPPIPAIASMMGMMASQAVNDDQEAVESEGTVQETKEE